MKKALILLSLVAMVACGNPNRGDGRKICNNSIPEGEIITERCTDGDLIVTINTKNGAQKVLLACELWSVYCAGNFIIHCDTNSTK